MKNHLISSALMALLAGTVAGVTYLFLTGILNLKLSKGLIGWLSASTGITVAFSVGGVLKKEKPKDVFLKRTIPTLIGISIAYYLIWVVRI
jgi:uncharacterized membrane protein (UPF0136 family)